MAPVVEAYQAMRGGASFIVAVTFAAEIGDVHRFDNPRQLMSFSASSPPKARPARRCAARGSPWLAIGVPAGCWSKPPGPIVIPPGSAKPSRPGLKDDPKPSEILPGKGKPGCAPGIGGSAAGKKLPVVVAAIAREMAAFLWAIWREVAPA
ncbi:MAG TPA: transposase [Stellaceae bacterium]|jgi:hypothetical protein|nr:transposase [Stellaceae bacterium]